jgi:hypothetical protein
MRRLICLCAMVGCGGAAGGVDSAAAAADVAPHGTSVMVIGAAKAVSSLFVQEDPTLDPTKSAGQNADAVAMQLRGSACASANVTHTLGMTTVSVDFGTGCTVNHVGTISGMVSATVSKSSGDVSVALTFTSLTVNGTGLDGSFSVTTTTGTSFTATADLTSTTEHVQFSGTAVLDSAGTGVTLDGTGMSQSGSAAAVSYTAAGVHHTFQTCYADAGTLTVMTISTTKSGKAVAVTDVITFDSNTPTTGQVSVTVNGVPEIATLPAFGTCHDG